MQIKIVKTKESNVKNVNLANLQASDFGKYHTDHMLCVTYQDGKWSNAEITPFGNLIFSPFLSALHYGQAIFEGMKAYKANGKLAIFRIKDHWERLNVSCTRLAMPSIPEEIFYEGLKQLLLLDKEWALEKDGFSIYIRPFVFASDDSLGAHASHTFTFMIVLSPVGAYFSKILKIKAETEYSRAATGGVGFIKAAGNYATSFLPTNIAAKEGFDQILWLDANEHKYIQELGVTNVMFYVNDTFYTPSLEDKTILSGITRKSVIQYLKNNNYEVIEKKISMDELLEWSKKGELKEIFGIGTATVLTTIGEIVYKGISIKPNDANFTMNKKITAYISDVRYGRVKDDFNWLTILD